MLPKEQVNRDRTEQNDTENWMYKILAFIKGFSVADAQYLKEKKNTRNSSKECTLLLSMLLGYKGF